jgi:hypothetical protein
MTKIDDDIIMLNNFSIMQGKTITFVFKSDGSLDEIISIRKAGNQWYINEHAVTLKKRAQYTPEEEREYQLQFAELDDPANPEPKDEIVLRASMQIALFQTLDTDVYDTLYEDIPTLYMFEDILRKLAKDDPSLNLEQTFTIGDNAVSVDDGETYDLPSTGSSFVSWDRNATENAMLT